MPFIQDNTRNAVNEFNQYVKPVSLWADAWKRLRKNKMAILGLWIVGFFFFVTFFADFLPFYDYRDQEMLHINLPPSLQPAGRVALQKLEKDKAKLEETLQIQDRQDLRDALALLNLDIDKLKLEILTNPIHKKVYILGTDSLGRDVLARTIYGGRISILIGIVGTLTAGLIGVVLGSIAGFAGGWIDNFLSRIVDILYSLPYMLIVIMIMSSLPQGSESTLVLFFAIALISWLTMFRVVRGQIMSLKNSEFVEAAKSMGARTGRIIFRHLLPNTIGIVIVYSSLQFPSFIMSESFLSFLGLGISAPKASWGTLVSEGVQGMQLFPWRLFVPGLAMTIFLFAVNFIGDGLRDALDPQGKNRN